MSLYATNLLIALTWALFTGELTAVSLGTGFAVGFGVIWLLEPMHGDRDYHRRPGYLAFFIGWYLWELVISSLRVARAVWLPTAALRDGWLRVQLHSDRDVDITLLANLISLAPGTLTVDVAPDRSFLLVHALLTAGDDEGAVQHELETKLQGRLLALLGRTGSSS